MGQLAYTLDRQMRGHTLEMAKLYYAFSDERAFDKNIAEYTFDEHTKGIVDVLAIGAKRNFESVAYIEHEEIKYKEKKHEEKNVVVCFSGGKDSTAAAMVMREKGYNVYLYYVQGINKSYPDELQHARDIANLLGMPLAVERVSLSGKTTFHDNPVKNQFIASLALDWAIENGIGTKICFGDFYTDNVTNSSFLEAWSDCQEMWKAHRDFVRTFVPTYDIFIPFKNYIETMDIVAGHKDILDKIQGCVLPYRFRKTTKVKNEEKYGVELLPNRCGSCWKCCVEYIHYADTGIMPYNKALYIHCMDFLKGKMAILHGEIIGRDYESVYKAFLFNDFKYSKLYENK